MTTLLDHFSDRSRMVIFLCRKDAGSRGAAALAVGDLLRGIIHEDQGELAKRFAGHVIRSGPIQPPVPFFSAEIASQALLRLRTILSQQEPIADSVFMPMSPSLEHVLHAATALAEELHHSQVQPLHLVAAILGQEGSEPAEILQQAGVSKAAVVQALQSQLP